MISRFLLSSQWRSPRLKRNRNSILLFTGQGDILESSSVLLIHFSFTANKGCYKDLSLPSLKTIMLTSLSIEIFLLVARAAPLGHPKMPIERFKITL